MESNWYVTGHCSMHARAAAGPGVEGRLPVVLVHGLGMSSRYMAPLADVLKLHFPVHAPDLPGFGLSEKPARILSVPELSEALRAFLDVAEISRAHFIGNSLGCEILVEFARLHPNRVATLVLQGPTPDLEARSVPAKLLFFSITIFFERWSIIWVALQDYLRCGPTRYIETFQRMVEHRISEKLPQVSSPTLVVWGTRDFVLSRTAAQKVADLLPNGRLIVVEGAAHGMNYSHPAKFASAILPSLLRRSEHEGA